MTTTTTGGCVCWCTRHRFWTTACRAGGGGWLLLRVRVFPSGVVSWETAARSSTSPRHIRTGSENIPSRLQVLPQQLFMIRFDDRFVGVSVCSNDDDDNDVGCCMQAGLPPRNKSELQVDGAKSWRRGRRMGEILFAAPLTAPCTVHSFQAATRCVLFFHFFLPQLSYAYGCIGGGEFRVK